ncbi:MAG: hypothetical protein WD824_15135 [Cyclobacteriaceae bacterium]
MVEQNLEYIKEELSGLGFKNIPEKEIADKLRLDPDKFQTEGAMRVSQKGKMEDVLYGIFFKKYERQDMYHAYAYQATLKNDPAKTQLFRISFNNDFTLPEAFNLLNSRAVHKLILDQKTSKLSTAWFQMDFNARDVHGNYKVDQVKINDRGYLVGVLLNKHPIREIQDPKRLSTIVSALYQGNAEPVTLLRNGKEIHAFVQAAPRRNGIDFYTANNKVLGLDKNGRERTAGKIMEGLPGRRKGRGRAF